MTDCTLDACRICTGCAHQQHYACRRLVLCPGTGTVRPCRCCGQARTSGGEGEQTETAGAA